MKVVGIIQKKGEYQGREYNNLMIHCIVSDRRAVGELTEVLKVRMSAVDEIFGKRMTDADFDDLVGKEIRASYNRYGNVELIDILDD